MIEKLIEKNNKVDLFEAPEEQIRFRASIYVDVYVAGTDLETAREQARAQVEQLVSVIGANEGGMTPEGIYNPYVGDVAKLSSNLLKPLDREI